MVMYVVVMAASKRGRIDSNMMANILHLASSGKPMLICLNQVSRWLDWCTDAAQACKACKDTRSDVLSAAKDRQIKCGPIAVYLTEIMKYSAHQEEMEERNIKTTEHVSVNWHALRQRM